MVYFHFENSSHIIYVVTNTCAGSHVIVGMGHLVLQQVMHLSFIALNVLNTNCTNKISKLLTTSGEMKLYTDTGQNSHTNTSYNRGHCLWCILVVQLGVLCCIQFRVSLFNCLYVWYRYVFVCTKILTVGCGT